MKMRKIISLVLALVLVCSIIPFAVFAEGEVTSVTFDFSGLTGKGTDISSSPLATFQNCASDASVLTAVTAVKIYDGNGSGGWKPNTAGLIKTGTGSVKGEITMTFTKAAAKVEIVCHAWKNGDKDTVAVNGGTAQTAPNTDAFGTLTFDITASESIHIVTNKRTFIQSITVTFEGATGGEEEKPCEHGTVVDYVCADCGEVVAPAADSVLTIEEAIKLGNLMSKDQYTENKYYVTGVIKNVYNTTYGNMYITDETGNELCIYGTYSADGKTRYDALETKPVAGDTVKVYGVIGKYNDPQMKNGWIVEHTPAETVCEHPNVTEYVCDDCGTVVPPAADSVLSIEEANKLGGLMSKDVYTADKYYVTGVITEVYNTTYGNMYITDEAGNVLTVYGTYSADGSVRYDALETKPVAGDTVTVYGIIGKYNEPQMKNGWIVEHIPAENPENPENPEEPEVPEEPVVPETLAEQIAEAEKLANGEYLPYESTITGTIIDDPTPSSRTEGQYKFTVSDGTNTILCYYTPVADGVVPAKGDSATVVGKLTAFNGAAQFDETAIAVVVNNVEENPETPEQPGTGDEAPETSGVSIAAMAILSVLSGSALVLLKKKEF